MTTCIQVRSKRPDTLRWAIFIALLTSSAALAGPALQPAAGPGGTPVVNNGHGVPVIDIVAPNAKGLSHNQFLDYNVGKPGVVLNNALQPGQSQLAGALAANPQFQGQAASTILNEVISRNASVIEGPQEIFGRPADYILANPNGITLNGGSFINTTRAGFVVGTPLVEEQQLRLIDTLQASGSLQVAAGGQANSEGALDLVAPRIDSQGPLTAAGDLTLIAGRNRIDAGTGDVLEHQPGVPASIDANLFGAMRAGRIRVVSTAEGAGVRMGPTQVSAQRGISIRSAGDLAISGTGSERASLQSAQGELSLAAADDLTLTAVEGKARRIDIKAGNTLTLDAQARQDIQRDREQWNSKAWFVTTETYDRTRTTTTHKQQGTQLQAGDIALSAGGDMRLRAAELDSAGELRLDSAGALGIEAGIDSLRVEEQIRHRKNLWRGDRDSDQTKETAQASVLRGQRLVVDAGGDLTVTGSRLESTGDMQLKGKQVTVTTTTLEEIGNQRDYRGDLVSGTFFGNRDGNDRQGQAVAGSDLDAKGNLSVIAEQVTIKGSNLASQGDSVLYSEKGLLSIEADRSTLSTAEHESDSKLFGLIGTQQTRNSRQEQLLVSDVTASSDLRLASAEEMRIQGAKLGAGGKLQVEAKGDLLVDSAQADKQTETLRQTRGLSASARQTQQAQDGKPDSRQFEASLGYRVSNSRRKERETTQVSSELKGTTVELTSGGHLQVNGSKVQASAGDLTVQAARTTLGATHDSRESDSEQTRIEGALAVTGGIDRLGSAFTGQHQQSTAREATRNAVRSELLATGDIQLATGNLLTQAARVQAGGALGVQAERIDNQAVENVGEREQGTRNWRASLGASLEYRDISRPIERLVEGEEAARFQQASVEDALTAPSLGADVTVDHLLRLENQRRGYAQASELSGASVTVRAKDINDQGTQWRADEGTLTLQAERHQMLAATDTTQTDIKRQDVGGDVRVDTSTGQDINARVAGKGGSLETQDRTTTARPGTLYGQRGIQVQLGSDGRYEGTHIDGGEGDVSLHSDGTLTLAQATDSTSQMTESLAGNGWAKGGNRPGSTGIDGRGYLDKDRQQRLDTKAQVAQVDAKGDVSLSSGGDLLIEGTRIGSRETPVANVRLDSGGLLQIEAARDTHQASGARLGGGLELAAKTGTSKGGGIGGHFTHGSLDERSDQAVDARITSAGTLSLSSRAREAIALRAQGLQASAARIDVQTFNGGLLLEGSGNRDYRNNLDITAGAGISLSQGELDSRALHGRVRVDLDKRDNQTWNANTWRADRINLLSQGDARLEGTSLEAQRIQGDIGGDLLVASRKDRVDTLTVAGDARLSQEKNPQGYTNAAKALAGPASGKIGEKTSAALGKAEPGLSPTFKLEVSHQQRDTVAHQATLKGREGIGVKVGGDARLVGARLQSANGPVDLQAASITRETLTGTDYRRDVSVDASNSPVDLGTAIAELAKGKGAADGENPLDLGLLRTSGYSRSEQWVSEVRQNGDR
ncbi:hemagglutinin repeat-containing protein [Pseudomonas monteilii]|nr:hemagglutinin repeat-containing protein [Pseudomonas monteilii]